MLCHNCSWRDGLALQKPQLRVVSDVLIYITGAISEGQVVAQAWILLLGGLGVAYTLDR